MNAILACSGATSPSIRARFKYHVGMKIHEYLTDQRMRAAIGLLRHNTLEIYVQVAINWQAFPSVSDSVSSSFLPTSPLVILVYGLTDCNLYVEQIKKWSELTQLREEIEMVGVISHPYEVTARRYLLQAPRPYPGRVDSTNWFVNRFRLGKTPALLLVSSKGAVRVIYPRNEAQADSEKNRLLDALL